MQKRLGFLIDLGKCVGCKSCEIACMNEHQFSRTRYRRVLNIGPGNQVFEFLSLSCNHCLNPECIRVCTERCYKKRRDGIVLNDSTRCNGCQRCEGACPFSVPKMNPQTKKVSKCNFCSELIDQGLEPACVSVCIVGALRVVNLMQPLPFGSQQTLPNFPMIQFTKPSIRFLLPKNPICFGRIP